MKLSIKEYMESRKVSRRTIYNHIESGQLETIKEKNKIYIIKENLNKKNTKKKQLNSLLNFYLIDEIKKFDEQLKMIEKSYEILQSFNYNFLYERLSTIEKSLVSFLINSEKETNSVNKKSEEFTTNISEQINSLEKKFDKFFEYLTTINEQNQNLLEKNIQHNSEKFDFLINKIENLENKMEDFLKKLDTKKSFGLFSKGR